MSAELRLGYERTEVGVIPDSVPVRTGRSMFPVSVLVDLPASSRRPGRLRRERRPAGPGRIGPGGLAGRGRTGGRSGSGTTDEHGSTRINEDARPAGIGPGGLAGRAGPKLGPGGSPDFGPIPLGLRDLRYETPTGTLPGPPIR